MTRYTKTKLQKQKNKHIKFKGCSLLPVFLRTKLKKETGLGIYVFIILHNIIKSTTRLVQLFSSAGADSVGLAARTTPRWLLRASSCQSHAHARRRSHPPTARVPSALQLW
eukprot:PhM_4_TR15749/c0_g1_i1/m.26393